MNMLIPLLFAVGPLALDGAVVGCAVGSQAHKDVGYTVYDLSLLMDNGDRRSVTVAATGGLRDGSRVKVSGDHVTPI